MMERLGITLLLAATSLFIAPVLSAQQYQGRTGILFACIRDGVQTYTASPRATDAACRAITYRIAESSHAPPVDSPGMFRGFRCSGDCSGHRAGYEWASRRGTSSISNCRGNSRSFVEGCMAYVSELTGERAR